MPPLLVPALPAGPRPPTLGENCEHDGPATHARPPPPPDLPPNPRLPTLLLLQQLSVRGPQLAPAPAQHCGQDSALRGCGDVSPPHSQEGVQPLWRQLPEICTEGGARRGARARFKEQRKVAWPAGVLLGGHPGGCTLLPLGWPRAVGSCQHRHPPGMRDTAIKQAQAKSSAAASTSAVPRSAAVFHTLANDRTSHWRCSALRAAAAAASCRCSHGGDSCAAERPPGGGEHGGLGGRCAAAAVVGGAGRASSGSRKCWQRAVRPESR